MAVELEKEAGRDARKRQRDGVRPIGVMMPSSTSSSMLSAERRQARFEKAFVTQSDRTAVFGEQPTVDREQQRLRDPARGFAHLASSRRALR